MASKTGRGANRKAELASREIDTNSTPKQMCCFKTNRNLIYIFVQQYEMQSCTAMFTALCFSHRCSRWTSRGPAKEPVVDCQVCTAEAGSRGIRCDRCDTIRKCKQESCFVMLKEVFLCDSVTASGSFTGTQSCRFRADSQLLCHRCQWSTVHQERI